jgi:hypothetical protein
MGHTRCVWREENCIQGSDEEQTTLKTQTQWNLQEAGLEAMDRIRLIQNGDKWWALVNTVMHPLVP